jgi:hypothetical protein
MRSSWFKHHVRATAARRRSWLTLLEIEQLEKRIVPGFGTPINYVVHAVPRVAAFGDFNHDGKLDLAAVNEFGADVSVLLGNGDGTYQARTDIEIGVKPYDLIVADVNGDGNPDILTADQSVGYQGSVSVLLGNGNGTFQAPLTTSVPDLPDSVALGDVNGDGKLDLLTSENAGLATSVVHLFLGNGNGTFGSEANLNVDAIPLDAEFAQLRGPGQPLDIITANIAGHSGVGSVSVLLGNGNGTFLAATNINIGARDVAIRTADFNNDGKLDIAVVDNTNPGNVTIALGNGNGTFQAATNLAAGKYSFNESIADINGDGKPDLVVASSADNTLKIFLGNGNGTFGASINVNTGIFPTFAAAGDVNGDGKVDLAVCNYGSNTVGVMLNQGGWPAPAGSSLTTSPVQSPSFRGDLVGPQAPGHNDVTDALHRPPDAIPPGFNNGGSDGVHATPRQVVFADINHDGIPDMIAANDYGSDVSVLLGNGDGTFQKRTDFELGIKSYAVIVADINGDGNPDIITCNSFNYAVSVLLGNGNGTFQAGINSYAGHSLLDFTLVDINSDGKLDVIAATGANVPFSNNNPGVVVMLGNGNGTFGPATTFNTDKAPVALAMGDFNGDGKLDIVTADRFGHSFAGDISVLLGNGNGTFGTPTNLLLGATETGINVADVNGDGKQDIIITDDMFGGSSQVTVALGNGNGTFQSPLNYVAGKYTFTTTVTDINGDGKLDLLAASTGDNTIQVLLGNGDGTFKNAVSQAAGNGPEFSAVGDINGDGHPDLGVCDYYGNTVTVLFGNYSASSTGNFAAAVNINAGTAPNQVAVADVNGDGKPDLITANYGSNNVSVLLGNGNGTFGAAANFAVGTNPTGLVLLDLNQDGKPDIAVSNGGSNTISVLLGNGNGTFKAAVNFSVGHNPVAIGVQDVNRDGKPDLVTANKGSNNLSLLFNNGNGTFQSALNISAGPQVDAIAAGDFNSDGFIDGVAASFAANLVTVFLNNGHGGATTANYSVGVKPTGVAVADVNGDGRLDLIITNSASNTVSVLLGNGNGTFKSGVNFATGSTPSFVAAADINDDGKLDLIVTNSGSGTVSILLGNGNGTFQAATNLTVGTTPENVAVADLNRDGALDLVTANRGSNNVSVLLATKPPAIAAAFSNHSGGWEAPAGVSGESGMTANAAPLDVGVLDDFFARQRNSLEGVFVGGSH